MKQNFIKTADKETAEKFMLFGFQLVSHIGNMYTFLNQVPKNFSFDEVDKNNVLPLDLFSLFDYNDYSMSKRRRSLFAADKAAEQKTKDAFLPLRH